MQRREVSFTEIIYGNKEFLNILNNAVILFETMLVI